MFKNALVLTGLLGSLVFAPFSSFAAPGTEPLDPKFFANAGFQNDFPGASVLHLDTQTFLKDSLAVTFQDGDALVAAIQAEEGLAQAVLQFASLTEAEKLQTMQRIFNLEVKSSGLAAPTLIFDNTAKRSTFFDFDPKVPGTGKVILNPAKLFKDANPYAALLFLIHETRHSYQFQLGFMNIVGTPAAVSDAYAKGFLAQRRVFDQAIKVSFCDFLTLNQEYEAFLFGNYVMQTLTAGTVDTSDMGTLASQYVLGNGLLMDLPALAQSVSGPALLDAFNELEKAQYNAQ